MSHGRAIDPLPVEDFPQPSDVDNPGFEDLFNQLVGDAATHADGFDQDVAQAILLLDELDNGLDQLSGADGGTLDDTFADILTLNPDDALADVTGLVTDLPPVNQNIDNLGGLLVQASPTPGPGTGGGGGNPPTLPPQSANCGTHGDSQLRLSDPTGTCYAATALPVVSIADGICRVQCIMDGTCFAGATEVRATKLQTGDPKLWSISNDTVTPQGSSSPVSRVIFTLSPYKTGHFDAIFLVNTSRNPNGETWCCIVDVIA